MIRVIHVISSLNVGGAEGMLCRLAMAMDRREFAPEVIMLSDGAPLADRLRDAGIPVRSLHLTRSLGIASGLPPNPAALGRLVAWLRERRPCVVQAWMYHSDLLAGLAGRVAGVPVAWGIRRSSFDPRYFKPTSRWIVRACAHLSGTLPARIVCGSEAARVSHARAGYATDRMMVIPNGFDLGAFSPDEDARGWLRHELGLPPDTPLVGLVGRWNPHKDHQNFFAAAARLRVRRPDVHYVLCGEGMTLARPEVARLVERNGLGANTHLLGLRADVARIDAGLDVAALSSLSEGFPNVVGEAMACGVPCVVTNVGDAAVIVGDTGRVVPPRDPAALAEALAEMLALPPEQRRGLGAAARRRMRVRFSLDAIARRYETVYRDLAGESTRWLADSARRSPELERLSVSNRP